MIAAAAIAVAPAMGQDRGAPAAAPTQGAGAGAFQAGPDGALGSQNGRPAWEVYGDCWFALNVEFLALNNATGPTPRPAPTGTMALFESPLDAMMRRAADRNDEAACREARDKRMLELNAIQQVAVGKAVAAYAASTGKSEAEAQAFIQDAPQVAALDAGECTAVLR
jgi:hypothetical protein